MNEEYLREELKRQQQETREEQTKKEFWRNVAGWVIFVATVLLIVVIFNTGTNVIPIGFSPEECGDFAIQMINNVC